MNSPRETLTAGLDRATEIIWWNRSLTKLNQFSEFQNATEFVSKDLIQQRGPYVEYVRSPLPHSDDAETFLSSLGYDDRVRNAVRDVLFDGDRSLPLYQHQAETIRAIEEDPGDNILAVPTATGKTESFFLPILNDCVQMDEGGLKALIIYPMKTLEVDQLNRFLEYLYHVNRNLDPENQLKIGIWDGDTPDSVGNRSNDIEPNSPIRGLICPETKEKLKVYDDHRIGTEYQDYSWIRVTREGIRTAAAEQTVDILITNPEALDYLYVNPDKDTRAILGERPNQQPLKHVVYDEAHVWSGIKGAAISLLSRRLKHFYQERNPQITMVSATIDNPLELAERLADSKPNDINSVEFTPEPIKTTDPPDFTQIKPCSLGEIVRVLYYVNSKEYGPSDFYKQAPELSHARETLESLRILEYRADQLQVHESVVSWLVSPLFDEIERLIETGQYVTPDDVIEDPDGIETLSSALLGSESFTSHWKEFVQANIPEVGRVAEWFEEGTGSVGFRRYDELIELVDDAAIDNPEGVLNTIMLFGRMAGILTDKYHVFLSPPSHAYWCADCAAVRRQRSCPTCGSDLPEVRFCRNCHYPYHERHSGGEDAFVPMGHGEVDSCPGCSGNVSIQDVNVPTSTLLSFMLTELCRSTPSKKTLVFSDSRSTSETIAKGIRDQEYLLVAEALYVQYLLDNSGVASATDLFYAIREDLRDIYYEPLIANAPENDQAENRLNELLTEIRNNASLFNCTHLFDGAIVVPETLFQEYTGDQLAVAFKTFEIFAQNLNYTFTKSGIEIEGFTYERLEAKLHRDYQFEQSLVDQVLPAILSNLISTNAIRFRSPGELQEEIQVQEGPDSQRTVKKYLSDEAARLEQLENFDEIESAVFTRELQNDDTELRLVPTVAYCENCFTAIPSDGEQAPSRCVSCGESVELYDRFEVTAKGYIGSGYAEIDSGWDYALDHWGHDVSTQVTERDLEPMVIGQHKGDMPASLRGSVEEGFRKSDPDINIVSATPTMELGVDIGTLDTVTQVGIPPTLTNYIQRSGRTGRSQGSASLVTTAIQSNNPIDTHYFSNIESFFAEFKPVKVPDPMKFEELLAGHIMTEIVGYLARNQHGDGVFENIYWLGETTSSSQNYGQRIQRKLTILRRYVDEKRPDTQDWVHDVFGDKPMIAETFDDMFSGKSRYSLAQRSERTFGDMENLDASGASVESLSENVDRLDLWLGKLGYLANYRSFGSQVPVRYSGRSEGIEFEAGGRLFEMYPGPQNARGGDVLHLGSKYIVKDVKGREALETFNICDNHEECERPYEPHQEAMVNCPYCGKDMIETTVHRIGTVSCRPASNFESNYRTYPIVSTHIEEVADADDHTTSSTSLFGMNCTIVTSQFEVLTFVYAFEQYQNQQTEPTVRRSEAAIDIESEEEIDFEAVDFDELLNDVSQERYAPVGQQMLTNGIRIDIDLEQFQKRYQHHKLGSSTATWSQALTSFEQTFNKAIAVVAECDLDDFTVDAKKTDDAVQVHVVDGREGGNGISWQITQSILDSDRFETEVADVVDCEECRHYCNQCLLLERTPGFYLANDLLDRQIVLELIAAFD